MLITVNLLSPKLGEIKEFFSKYLKEESNIDAHVVEWIYVYREPLAALNVIRLFLAHIEEYKISLWVQIGDEDIIQVRKSNKEKFIEKIEDIVGKVMV